MECGTSVPVPRPFYISARIWGEPLYYTIQPPMVPFFSCVHPFSYLGGWGRCCLHSVNPHGPRMGWAHRILAWLCLGARNCQRTVQPDFYQPENVTFSCKGAKKQVLSHYLWHLVIEGQN